MEEENKEELIAGAPMRFQENAVNAEPVFPSPFNSKIGNSTVDLSDKANNDAMLKEYDNWWDFGQKKGFLGMNYLTKDESVLAERNQMRDEWYQKYHGMSYEDYKKGVDERTDTNSLKLIGQRLDNNFQGLSAPGIGLLDFGMDAAGTLIPGFDKVDEKYDKATMLDNPVHQLVRRVSSIVLPTILGGGYASSAVNAKLSGGALFTKPWFTKLAADLMTQVGVDATVLALSDVGEDDSITTELSNMFPETFGPKGRIPLPDFFRTADSDSPGIRKVKNMLESAPFAMFGSVIGAFIDTKNGKQAMGWFDPKDNVAQQYKQGVLKFGGDPDKLIRIQEIDELLSLGRKNLTGKTENMLINEKLNLEAQLGDPDIDISMNRQAEINASEADAAIDRKIANNFEQLELDINGLDPDLNADLLSDAAKTKQQVPPGNVARNIADTTAIKAGTSKGDPAPIITDSMRRKGLMVGSTSRDAVMGVGEAARMSGRFDAIVDGVRFSAKEMNAAAWGIYMDIIDPMSTVDDVKALFLENRDVKNLMLGKFKIEVINEDQARAAAFAMRDLVDRFLGREVTASSGRVMDTLGREAATIAASITDMAPFVDDTHAMDIVLDKLLFLMDEYALNKYLSGWSLRNKNWFDQLPPRNAEEGIQTLLEEFKTAENSIHAKNLKFTKTLKELRKNKPEALRPLIDAYAHTNGDVDSLAKLYKWAADQIHQ